MRTHSVLSICVVIGIIIIGLVYTILGLEPPATKPNIVFIMVDDMGWNDVSFHGSDQILTPNIDLLAYSGVSLGRYYSHAICTPSRTALLTGKYAYKTGMQGYPLTMAEDRGIPTSLKLLPEYLQDAGYSTHLVGKWHVGSSRQEYLPTKRGFDSHFGHRSGCLDYYEYTYEEEWTVGQVSGLALFRNQTPAWDVEGYITDVYTEHAKSVIVNHDTTKPLFLLVAHNAVHSANAGAPLQAPPEVVREMRHVESPERRIYAAMVKILDDSVGIIVDALRDKGMLENTIIVLASDNGGMTTGEYNNVASNYPLRGIKMSPYEGGVRVVGLIWSAHLNNTGHYWDGYMHVTDWLPTLLSAADIDAPEDTDGVDQWDNINSNLPSQRTTMYEIDDIQGYASVIFGDYKLIMGNVPLSFSTYQGTNLTGIIGRSPSYYDSITGSIMYGVLESIGLPFNKDDLSLRNKTTINCDIPPASTMCFPGDGKVCLYNIIQDPCETTELSAKYPDLVSTMKRMADEEIDKVIPRIVPIYRNPLSAPSLFNYTWDVWIK